MPSGWIGCGQLCQSDIFTKKNSPAYFPVMSVASWSQRRKIGVGVVTFSVLLLTLLLLVPYFRSRRVDDQRNRRLRPEDLQADVIKALMSSMDFDKNSAAGTRRRFTKNCTLMSSTTGLVESVPLHPDALDYDEFNFAAPAGNKGSLADASFARIIHRMWKTDEVPVTWTNGATSCKRYNPDHHYCHWTDVELETFIAVEYPWFLTTYRGYTYNIQRVDAARYFVLYHYGGTYLDLDLVCRRPLADLLDATAAGSRHPTAVDADDIVLAETLPLGVTNEFMAVRRARDPFMREVVVGLQPNAELWYVLSYPTIMFSTGPMYLSDRLWQMQSSTAATESPAVDGRTTSAKAKSTPSRVRIIDRRQFLDEYFDHLVGSSWHCWDGVVIWAFFRIRYYLLAVAILAAVALVAFLYRRRRHLHTLKVIRV